MRLNFLNMELYEARLQNTLQQRDDGHHHQQFNQRKTCSPTFHNQSSLQNESGRQPNPPTLAESSGSALANC